MANLAIVIVGCLAIILAKADEISVNRNNTNSALLEGDIVLTRDQERQLERDLTRDTNESIFEPQHIVVAYDDYNWKDGIVYYELSSQAYNDKATNDSIHAAIADYHSLTCIQFRKRTASDPDYIHFFKGSGCYSNIGRVGGQQDISIGNGCERKGIVIHEIFHALGRWHEQSRRDRDLFVNIHDENIIPDTLHNFRIIDPQNFNPFITSQSIEYDYRSVMHYGAYAFTSNGQPTITPKDNTVQISDLGQRDGLSQSDIAHINSLYCNNIVGTWTTWSDWSSCSRTCNTGIQTRTRTCEGGTCTGTNFDSRVCNTDACPDPPTWSSWSVWSGCSRTCNTGRQSRTRTCMNGDSCVGANAEFRDCNTNACPNPPTWSSWGSWSECSQTCNGGTRQRRRNCLNGSNCPGSASQIEQCNQAISCTPDPNNGEWSEWTDCTVTCGGGTRMRSRQCGLSDASLCTTQTEECSTQTCPPLPMRGMEKRGCYSLPEHSSNLILLEKKTDDLSDNPLTRTDAVEKCGKGAMHFNYTAFSVTLGFCISGSNDVVEYYGLAGPFCRNGEGGTFLNFYYHDVYEIVDIQAFSDSAGEVFNPSATTTPSSATEVLTPSPTVLDIIGDPNGGSISIPSAIIFSITIMMSVVAVLM